MSWQVIILTIVTPLLFVCVGIYAKRLGRRDGDKTPNSNNYAVGTQVFIMSFAAVLGDFRINVNGGLEGNFLWVIFYFILIFISVDVDRYSSWERDAKGVPTNKKHWIKGIIVPNLAGVFAFCFYRFFSQA